MKTLELPDAVYDALSREAKAEGAALVDWIAARLLQDGRVTNLPHPDAAANDAAAEARLLAFAGIWHSGNPHSGDNDQIDTDLYS